MNGANKSNVKFEIFQRVICFIKPFKPAANILMNQITRLQIKLAVIKQFKSRTKQQRKVVEQKIIFGFDCINKGLNRNNFFVSHYL